MTAAFLLLFASTLGFVSHAITVFAVFKGKEQNYKIWSLYLATVSLLFGIAAWSYVTLLTEVRTFEQHASLVRWLGIPLWLHPSLLLVGALIQGEREKQRYFRSGGNR